MFSKKRMKYLNEPERNNNISVGRDGEDNTYKAALRSPLVKVKEIDGVVSYL